MNPRRSHNYKALYIDCSKQGADKDQYITLLEEQYKIMAEALWTSQQREEQQIEINTSLQQENTELKQHNALQSETILAQAEQDSHRKLLSRV